MSKLGKAKLRFEVVVSLDNLIGEEELDAEFGGKVEKFIRWLYKNEGCWFDEELKFVGAEPVENPKKRKRSKLKELKK